MSVVVLGMKFASDIAVVVDLGMLYGTYIGIRDISMAVACLVSRTGAVVSSTADRAMFIDTSTSVCVEILTISSTRVDAVMLFGLMLSVRRHLSVCLGRG